jgi:CheY-like chemotaxis protein
MKDMEKALSAGCNDYLTKPIKKEELLLLIEKHIISRIN